MKYIKGKDFELYKNNCFKILPTLEDSSVHLIATDPPYFLDGAQKIGSSHKNKKRCIDIANKTQKWDTWKDRKEYRKDMYLILNECYRILKQERHFIMFCNYRDLSLFMDYGLKIGFKIRQPLFWKKTNPTPQVHKVSPSKSIEIVLWLTKGKSKQKYYNWELGKLEDIIFSSVPQKEGNIERHPTQKPLYVIMKIIAFLSKPNNIVLDPFMGNGTTGFSSLATGRKFIGIEKETGYFNNAKSRFSKMEKNSNWFADKHLQKARNKLLEECLELKLSKVKKERIYELLGRDYLF